MDYVKINREMRYLGRAVDHEGEVLESYVATTRDKAAALASIKKAQCLQSCLRHFGPLAVFARPLTMAIFKRCRLGES